MGVNDMLKGKLSATSQNLNGKLSAGYILYIFQDKEVIPKDEEQVIIPDKGFTALRSVTVAAIPSSYGRISFNGYELKVE